MGEWERFMTPLFCSPARHLISCLNISGCQRVRTTTQIDYDILGVLEKCILWRWSLNVYPFPCSSGSRRRMTQCSSDEFCRLRGQIIRTVQCITAIIVRVCVWRAAGTLKETSPPIIRCRWSKLNFSPKIRGYSASRTKNWDGWVRVRRCSSRSQPTVSHAAAPEAS